LTGTAKKLIISIDATIVATIDIIIICKDVNYKKNSFRVHLELIILILIIINRRYEHA